MTSPRRSLNPRRADKAQEQQAQIQGDHAGAEEAADPPDDMLHAEWAALQATIREIHRSEEQHQAAEREVWATQVKIGKRLNRITTIGAGFSFFGLLLVAGSLWIADRTARDGAVAARAAAKQAGAAVEANKNARELYVADHRPWVTADADVAGPVSYNVNGATIDLVFTLRNSGHTPALGVLPGLFVIPHGLMAKNGDPERACLSTNGTIGIYVFPGETPQFNTWAMISTTDTDEFWRKFPTFKPMIAPEIYVCIVYWGPGEDKPHHTRFQFKLMRKHGTPGIPARGNAALFVDEGDVPKDNLGLQRVILTNESAD